MLECFQETVGDWVAHVQRSRSVVSLRASSPGIIVDQIQDGQLAESGAGVPRGARRMGNLCSVAERGVGYGERASRNTMKGMNCASEQARIVDSESVSG